MENLVAFLIAVLLVFLFGRSYTKKLRTHEQEVRKSLELRGEGASKPRAQHPRIDVLQCIGCATCVAACPEGDVLGMMNGRAVLVHADKCVGHGLCADACPVGAIEMVMSSVGVSADLPLLTPEHETTVPGLFIVGELGGLALIKNAVTQGRDCVDTIACRLAGRPRPEDESMMDVIVVGAGPSGIAASLRAIENDLRYLTIERDELGGTVAKYPRQKLVLTSPVEFPLYGKFNKMEISKEELLAFWDKVLHRADFSLRAGESVEDVRRQTDGSFIVRTGKGEYRGRNVVLALGRTGVPNRLGVAGEELPKVMYRLIEADHYRNKDILIVGGGDSAVEAAMGLARQPGNRVTLSYRRAEFSRIKERNARRIVESIQKGSVEVLFKSKPVEIAAETVRIEVNGEVRELRNDYVWIFAGGTSPNAFLKHIGVGFGVEEQTAVTAG